MRRAIFGLVLVTALTLTSVSRAQVDLSELQFALQFDSNKPVTKQGFVTKVDWQSPHVSVYLDVTDPKTNKVENWTFILGTQQQIQKSKWTPDTLKYRDEIIVNGSLARDGSNRIRGCPNCVRLVWAGKLAS
jgi:hypothetical protein